MTVDSTAKPHEINLTGDDGTSRPAIYELTGDSLKLCLSGTGPRPTDFSSTPGTKMAVMVLERKPK